MERSVELYHMVKFIFFIQASNYIAKQTYTKKAISEYLRLRATTFATVNLLKISSVVIYT